MKKTQDTSLSGFLITSLLVLSWGTLFGAGCAAAQQHQPILPPQATASQAQTEINHALVSRALLAPTPSADYRLGPGDLVEITLFNVTEEVGVTPRKTEVRVSQQGVITLPLLGEITVVGLTTTTFEQTLQERYKKYLHNPKVGVFVREYNSQQISVIGEVRQPGVFKLSDPKTLIDLLAMAGGITEKAGSQVHLHRRGPEGRESYVIDLYALTHNAEAANLPVQAGDVINVPEAGLFFVDGAVKKPGSFPLNRPYTLTQALSSAGGVDIELAKTSSITIVRRQSSIEAETTSINLDAIQAGKIADPQIEAEDQIIVPISGTKYIVKRFVGTLLYGFHIPIY
jgi:polysaccharide export outer membrane protein